MNKLVKLFLIVIGILISQSVIAQKEIIQLTGKIINKEDNTPVAFAHILNLKKNQSTIADTAGVFKIILYKGDSIRISSIGFQYAYFVLPDTAKSIIQNTVVYLSKKVYNLQAVDIYKERWESFEYDFLHTEIKENKNEDQINRWLKTIIDVEELKMVTMGARGVGFSINYKSKRDKQVAKLKKIKQYEQLEEIANKKFNSEIVSKLTGLSGNELGKFMEKCNFDIEFIAKTSEYELIVIIQEIFEVYQKENK